jgi:hypothetical protein
VVGNNLSNNLFLESLEHHTVANLVHSFLSFSFWYSIKVFVLVNPL